MSQSWKTPRARNESTLEQIRRDLLALRFEIPPEIFANAPDCPFAHDALEKLRELQRRVEFLTSRDEFHRSFYARLRNIDNQARGRWGEFAARVYLQTSRLIPYDSVELDQVTFETPYGGRRVDCFVKSLKLAVEVKSARINARRTLREQVQKDEYLLASGAVRTITWILFGGGSPRIRRMLADARISVELASEARLQPVLELLQLITLSSAPQEEVLAVMDSIFASGLELLTSRQNTSSAMPSQALNPTVLRPAG